MIDANASINDTHIQRIMHSADLYDLMCAKHGLNSPNTFVRGTKTIDFILGTKGVLDAIEYCGIRQFNADIISDHRALWIDLNIPKLLHKKLAPLYTRQPQMTSKNKRWSQYARKNTSTILRNLHVQSNISSLYENLANNAPRQDLITMLEQIDTDIQSAMLKGVSPTKQHSAWWSPQLHHAFLMQQYWLLKRKERITNISMKIPLTRILEQIPIDSPLHRIKDSKYIRRHLRNAQKTLNETRSNARDQRNIFLEQKMFQYRLLDKNKTAAKLQAMNTAELMPVIYRKLRAFLNPKTFQALNFIDIPSSSGVTRITEKDELEQTLLNHHRQHFMQAKNTPLATQDVISRFGLATDTLHSLQFRQGDSSEIEFWDDPKIKSFMQCLQPNPGQDPPQIDTTITVSQVIDGIKIWKERTSTSPSGRTLPLYKIWLQPDLPHEEAITGKEFFTMITDVINISKTMQYPLKRWTKAHNIFISKDPGKKK